MAGHLSSQTPTNTIQVSEKRISHSFNTNPQTPFLHALRRRTQCFKFETIQRQELLSKIDEFSTFLGKLAYQLIFNDLIEEGHNFRERDGSANLSSPEVPEVNTSLTLHLHVGQSHFQFQVHYLAPLSTLPFDLQKASRCLRRCRHKECGKNASCYCVGCSNVEQKIIVPYCGLSTGLC